MKHYVYSSYPFTKVARKKNARNRGRFTFYKLMGLLRHVH